MAQHPEEFTTIRVNLVQDNNALLLTPRDDAARTVLQQIIDATPGSLLWHGKGVTLNNRQQLIRADFACGGESYERVGKNFTSIDYAGAIKVTLDLSEIEDGDVTWKLREYAWHTDIAVDPATLSMDGLRLLPALTCKVCTGQLSLSSELEWQVCDSCADNCEHQYTEMIGQISGHLTVLPCCIFCGRCDPSWQPKENPMIEILNTMTEDGSHPLLTKHPDG